MTVQIPDSLEYRGKQYTIDCYPLEPLNAGGLVKSKFDFKETTNWRGYIASWRIEDYGADLETQNIRLVMCGLEDATVKGKRVTHLDALKIMGNVDAVRTDGNVVFASWFTGEIVASKGALLFFEPDLTSRTLHEEEIRFKVLNGEVHKIDYGKFTVNDIPRIFSKPIDSEYFAEDLPAFLVKDQ
jgi:hypothetical protein